MAQYIDKAVVVAEIERIMDAENENINSFEQHRNTSEKQRYNARMTLLEHILSFLDTLEVKEVDLEKETKKWWKERLHLNPENQLLMDAHQSVVFAKHFFELGIRSKATKASEFLKKHFEETPQEELDKEWEEIEPLNNVEPDVLEYADKISKT